MSTNQSEEQSRKAFKQAKKTKKQKPAETKKPVSQKHTRNQHKQHKKAEKKKSIKPRRRAFPIWLRIIVILLLAVAALMAGLMIGYGLIGDGNPMDALKIETWQHIIDIVLQE